MTTMLDYKDVLILPQASHLSSRKEAKLERKIVFKNGVQYNGIPIISANMSSVSTFTMADALAKHSLSCALHKHYSTEQYIDFFNKNDNGKKHWYTLGISKDDYQKFLKVDEKTDLSFICIDVANGYQKSFIDFVKQFRKNHPNKVIMAGNIVTRDGVDKLADVGVDVVKCGLGSGGSCITRIKTGVGCPQFTAVADCSEAADRMGVYLCADGGLTCAGDFSKAYGAGADFVMAGGLFAGHTECGGEIITRRFVTDELDQDDNRIVQTKMSMQFYGMSSETAMKKHSGGMAEYRSSEGKTVEVSFKGTVDKTVLDILGGIRSTMTYIGADTITDIPSKCNFIRVLTQSNEVFGKN